MSKCLLSRLVDCSVGVCLTPWSMIRVTIRGHLAAPLGMHRHGRTRALARAGHSVRQPKAEHGCPERMTESRTGLKPRQASERVTVDRRDTAAPKGAQIAVRQPLWAACGGTARQSRQPSRGSGIGRQALSRAYAQRAGVAGPGRPSGRQVTPSGNAPQGAAGKSCGEKEQAVCNRLSLRAGQ